jgi:Methyltransferase domain
MAALLRHLPPSFERFIGRDVRVMEIGVYSGGSLPMWREYFGKNCHVYGVDIEKACEAYRSDQIEILIGDQSDRSFWADIRKKIPRVDILIDDGGHHPEHQLITLEEMPPHLSPGGIYFCEDIHGVLNYFAAFVAGLASQMNAGRPSRLESEINSIHLYPMVAVIEKRASELVLKSEKRGTQWQPFLG